MTLVVMLMCVGLVAGVLGGLLGVGGSILIIPATMLLIDDPNQHQVQGAAMIVNFFVVLPAVVQHARAGAILAPIVRTMAPTAVVSVMAGVWLSDGAWFQGDNEIYLSKLFGVLLFYTAGYYVYRMIRQLPLANMDTVDAERLPKWKIATAVGLPMGLVGGLLGVGGGVVAVPCQQFFLKVPLRRAIANSATTIVPLSLVGATYKNWANAQAGLAFGDSLRLALCLIPTAIIGGYIGAQLTHILPRQVLRVAVILLICYGGISLVGRTKESPPPASRPAPATSTDQAVRTPQLPPPFTTG